MTTLQQQLASITNAGEAISFIENEIANIGVKQVYENLHASLKKNKEVLHFILANYQPSKISVFEQFDEGIRKDKAFILEYFEKVKRSLGEADKALKSDPENPELAEAQKKANTAAGYAPYILKGMHESLVNDEDILRAALTIKFVSVIEQLDPKTWSMDKEWAVKVARYNIQTVHYLPKNLKHSIEVCKALLDVHLAAFNFFDDEMKRNKSIQEHALSKDGYVFQIFPEDLRKNKQFIKSMLQECPVDQGDQRGYMIWRAVSPLNSDQELINLAIERNPEIFQRVYPTEKYSKKLFTYFLKVTPRVYKFVPENMKDDRDLFISLLSGEFDGPMRESIFKSSKWYDDPEFAVELIQKSSNASSYSYLKDELKVSDRLLNALYDAASQERYKSDGSFDPETSFKFVDQLMAYDKDKSRAYFLRAKHNDSYRLEEKNIDIFGLTYDDLNENLKKCLDINPSHIPALIFIGRKSKDSNEAIDCLKKAIAIEPENFSAHYNLGIQLMKAERYQEAIDSFSNALKIKNDDHSHAYIGKCLLKLDDVEKAIVALETATKNSAYLHDALFDLSKAYLKINHVENAIDAIHKANQTSDPPAYYAFLAEIYRSHTSEKDKAEIFGKLFNFMDVTKGKKEEQIKYLNDHSTQSDFNHFSFLSVYRRISDSLVNHIIEEGSYLVKTHLAKNPFIKVEHLDKLIEQENFTVLEGAISNQKINEQRLEEIITQDDGSYRYSFALLGALSNPNVNEDQVEKLLHHKFNWVRKKAAATIKKKIDYSKIVDRYILSGLMVNGSYTTSEQSEIAKMAEAAPVIMLRYKLPADRVGIEEYICAIENETLREDVIKAIIDPDIESWRDYVQDSWYEYGESEYGVNSLVDEVIIKEPDETEFRERFSLYSIVAFTPTADHGEPSVPENLKLGSLVHEAISGEKGSWDYEVFELEWEFRPEFITPIMGDYGRIVVGYDFNNVTENEVDIRIEGKLVESQTFGVDISLYILIKEGFHYLDFEVIREEIKEEHGEINHELVERYLTGLVTN